MIAFWASGGQPIRDPAYRLASVAGDRCCSGRPAEAMAKES